MLTMQKRHNFLLKSILGFENWTKKMSKIENPKYFWEENLAHTDTELFLMEIWKYVMIIDLRAEKITQIPHHKGCREYNIFPKGLKEPPPPRNYGVNIVINRIYFVIICANKIF